MHHTTAYHPQSNGMVERFHRSMKAALRASMNNADWINKLPWVLLGLRSSAKEDLDHSPAELIYQHALNLPGSIVDHAPANNPVNKPTIVKHHCAPQSYVPKSFQKCTSVWLRNDKVRRSLDPPFTGPFPIVHRGEKFFVIRIYGKEQSVSLDRLKPACSSEDEITTTRSGRISRPPVRFSSSGGSPVAPAHSHVHLSNA
jgi:hypothetical protein